MVANLNIIVFSFFDKREGADFKYDITFLKFFVQKYLNKSFLVPNLAIFIISQNNVIGQIQGRWFQVTQYFFRIPVEKYSNKACLVPNLGIFISTRNVAFRKIRGGWYHIKSYHIKYHNSFFEILAQGNPNIKKKHFYYKI